MNKNTHLLNLAVILFISYSKFYFSLFYRIPLLGETQYHRRSSQGFFCIRRYFIFLIKLNKNILFLFINVYFPFYIVNAFIQTLLFEDLQKSCLKTPKILLKNNNVNIIHVQPQCHLRRTTCTYTVH